jgi:diphosphomevalonate decarboxylase
VTYTATACSCSNIAFIKYWGNRDDTLRLPANGSISMNLSGLETVTTVRFSEELTSDTLSLNGQTQTGEALRRASRHLDHIRHLAGTSLHAEIRSRNNFPTGAGIASSASAFAALTVASCAALGLDLAERDLSALARLGSGSACRSVPGGYVEWYSGEDHASSYAETIAPPTHWKLLDLVAIVSGEHKAVGSTSGHSLASTSPLQAARIEDAPRRLSQCRDAILSRDFELLAEVIEQDTLMMHAVMMTSRPPLFYWLPTTLQLMQIVREWRASGIPACFTIDAGPNVHIITLPSHREQLEQLLYQMEGVQTVLVAPPGGPTRLVSEPAP